MILAVSPLREGGCANKAADSRTVDPKLFGNGPLSQSFGLKALHLLEAVLPGRAPALAPCSVSAN